VTGKMAVMRQKGAKKAKKVAKFSKNDLQKVKAPLY
jgi:hypothetical protein